MKTMSRTTKPLTYRYVNAVRFTLGLSISHMAELLGVSRQTVHNWKRGGKIKDPDIIRERLAVLLRVSAAERWRTKGADLETSAQRMVKLLALLGKQS